MTTFPRTTISPIVCPSAATSLPPSSTTRNSPDVSSSTPCRALTTARSAGVSASCSGSGAQTVMNGAVSVSPYTWVTSQPNSPSSRSIVAAAGAAPAVTTCTPAGTSPRACAAAFASEISTVGAAQSKLICSVADQPEHHRRIDLAQADVHFLRRQSPPRCRSSRSRGTSAASTSSVRRRRSAGAAGCLSR